MSLTENTLPQPVIPATAGIDWAKDDYAVCVVDTAGEVLHRVTLAYTKTGLSRLVELLSRHGVGGVGIERPDGPIVEALLAADLTVLVIPPSQVKALRRRYGDARGRFPTPDALACLAGVAPSTRESGKARVVVFRWAVDKQLRDAVCDFAGDSRHKNARAAKLYTAARARGHDHPHAVRILARAWIGVIWKCWTTNTPYNPDRHRALQQTLKQDQQVGG
jgi:transposase